MKASPTQEKAPLLAVHVRDAVEGEFDAVAMLRACSFYVVPPERSFAGMAVCSTSMCMRGRRVARRD